VDLIVS